MRVVSLFSVLIGLLSLLLGAIDHVLILAGRGAMLEMLASPAALLQVAIAMFLLALVLLVSQLVYGASCGKPSGSD
jgi:hypothetical protein